MRSTIFAIALTFGMGSLCFAESATPPPFAVPKGKVAITTPKDGAMVTSPLKVVMTSTVQLRPAGEDVNDHKSGHHHLIIDAGPIPAGEAIPADDKHIHYGKAQTEAEIKLAPGKHSLTLQLADGAHRSYGPTLSQTIHVTVK